MKCWKCERELPNDESFYRLRRYLGRRAGYEFTPICTQCFPNLESYHQRLHWHLPAPCTRCGRIVILEAWRDPPCQDVFCSRECQTSVWNARSYAKHRRPPPERACAVCDERFQPKRTDAIYCSSRCKQAAYRAAKVR